MWDVVDRGGGRVEIELARLAVSRAEQLEDILDVRRHTEPAPQEAFCQQGRRRQLGEPWKEATKSGGLWGSRLRGLDLGVAIPDARVCDGYDRRAAVFRRGRNARAPLVVEDVCRQAMLSASARHEGV